MADIVMACIVMAYVVVAVLVVVRLEVDIHRPPRCAHLAPPHPLISAVRNGVIKRENFGSGSGCKRSLLVRMCACVRVFVCVFVCVFVSVFVCVFVCVCAWRRVTVAGMSLPLNEPS